MIKKLFLIAFLLISLALFGRVEAQANSVDLYFFYGQGCPHCAQAEQDLSVLNQQYPNLNIKRFEVFYSQQNRQVYFLVAGAYGLDVAGGAVPGLFIGEKSLLGWNSYNLSQIRNEVIRCSSQKCLSPIEKVSSGSVNPNQNPTTSLRQLIVGWAIIIFIVLLIIFILAKVFSRRKNKI